MIMDLPKPGPTFKELGLAKDILQAVEYMGFEYASPIQAALIPIALTGADCIGQARTGTGKTAAFVLPILQNMDKEASHLQALILAPTRELTEQVDQELQMLVGKAKVRSVLVVGGKPIRAQVEALNRYPQVVVGTPGRVMDLLQRGAMDLSKLRVVVLDEADRMLDIGFRKDIEKILRSCNPNRQILLLSATMPESVERLARQFMKDPEEIDMSEDQVVVDTIEQFYCTVEERNKFTLLMRLLLAEKPAQAIVFCRTKRGAQKIYERIQKFLPDVETMHGDLQQTKRDRVMKKLRKGKARLVIATDVVGRGIDISGISHIINYDIPQGSDDYVHRVGRTGRMSSDSEGRAFTFVTPEQGSELTRIEMLINTLLHEYKFDGDEVFQAKIVKNVSEDNYAETAFSSGSDWDNILEDL